jgi:hypothetical protein
MEKSAILLLLLFTVPSAFSQITVQVATGEKIKTGQAIATHSEFDIGTINDLFDNDINSLVRTPNINPAIITLEFDKPFTLSSSKLYMITDGKWSLEAAMTLSDLDSHTGSYHALFLNNKIFNSVWDSNSFTAIAVKVVRLTAKRTSCCDGYVHINEWVLNATPQLTSLCIYPGAAKLLPGTSYTMQLLAKMFMSMSTSFRIHRLPGILRTRLLQLSTILAWFMGFKQVQAFFQFSMAHCTIRCLHW